MKLSFIKETYYEKIKITKKTNLNGSKTKIQNIARKSVVTKIAPFSHNVFNLSFAITIIV